MATFEVAAGTDWIATLQVGETADRWRLDDYDIWLQARVPGTNVVLLDLSLDDGRLVISDPVARRLEINVGWADIAPLDATTLEFDLLYANRTTEIRSRGERHTLVITPGITVEP
ncbi:hypothetical protein DFO45_2688 [Azorhizobium sp. AG788]|uniref:hypothetical protein n=1 Tax=Azorhizobium sp. AG788 TaxID=2183897 RepID=UPI00105E157E|nr:hypothetical protein [Azorhizobium sp. AG788]TDT94930.1 hypothetical protein DFO45_2688 [Azorhizobium sp. AG788]